MANMTFKANLIPQTDYGFELGSSDATTPKRWKINGMSGTPIEYIEGTQTAKTGTWTGNTTDSSLVEGKTIAYRLPYAGSGNATLTLTFADNTTSTAIPVYAGNTRLTTHYPANSVLIMTYDGTNWRTNPFYNVNTLLRTYASSTNLDVPLLGQSSAASATAAWTTYSDTYKDWYGAIPNDDTKRVKINLSTGHLTTPGGITTKGFIGTSNVDYGEVLPATAVEGQIFFQTIQDRNYMVPAGGSAGYALVKLSQADGDFGWQLLQPEIATMSVAEMQTGTADTPRTIRADYLKTALANLGGNGLTLTYNATNGIKLDHTNSISQKTSYVATTTTANSAGGSIQVTDVKYDAQGHITGSQDRTITLGLVTGYGDTTNPYASKTKNYILAAPSNANGVPTFRAMATADLPSGTWEAIGGGSVGKLNTGSNTATFLANDGSWLTPPGTYVLPKATTTILGGITIGNGLNIDNGQASVDWTKAPVTSVNGTTGTVVLSDLVIGSSHYNGSTTVTVSITDLGLSSPMTFKGVTDTTLVDGQDTKPINITAGGIIGSLTPANGDVVLQKDEQIEYLYTGSSWTSLGIASSYSLAEHAHGYIVNDGTMPTTVTATTGDHLLIADASDYNRIVSAGNLTFDASSPQSALSRAGTWVDFLQLSGGTMTGALKTQGLIGSLDYDYGEVLPTTATEGQLFFQVSYGEDYYVPAGGTAGYALVKNSNNDGDFTWRPAIPQGGTAGFALVKRSNADGDYTWGPAVPLGGTAGYALVKNTNADGDASWQLIDMSSRVAKAGDTMTGPLSVNRTGVGEAQIMVESDAGLIYLYSQPSTTGNRGIYGRNSAGTWSSMFAWEQSGKIVADGPLYGAVWNDYAEFRKDNLKEKELQEPGRCVLENGDGTLTLTQKRLERGCEIISDTFGFAIGEDKENGYNTPIASSGRVLAYPYESIEEFKNHIGWPVCSGPNGTVSIMTEKEEKRYPSRIIGTISEIPDYQIWGSGKIEVNNRVWIRIR